MKNLIILLFLPCAMFTVVDLKGYTKSEQKPAPIQIAAVAKLKGKNLHGNITFVQNDEDSPVHVTGNLHGMPQGSYGFHVHEQGDISGDDCMQTGPHFNPHKLSHGAPSDSERHVGDLGNIVFDEHSVAKIDFYDHMISLNGMHSIIGRGLVVHERADDLGKGNKPDSLTTGSAGARIACAVIGVM